MNGTNLCEIPETNDECTRGICDPFAVPHLTDGWFSTFCRLYFKANASFIRENAAVSITVGTASEDTDELFAHSWVET